MRSLIRLALVVAVGAGLVLGAFRLPDWRYHLAGSAAPASAAAGADLAAATKPVTRSTLVCSGPETVGVKGVDAKAAVAPTSIRVAAPPTDLVSGVLSSGAGSVSGPDPSAASAVTGAGSVGVDAIGGSGPLGLTPLAAPGAAVTQTSEPRSVLLSGKGSLAPGLAAAETTLITTGDQRGLSTSSCQAPAAETWLVGGGAEPGRRGRVVLTNPSPNGVTVDLDVYGAKGPVKSPLSRGIVVGSHKRTVVLLDAIAPGEKSPVIHVVASGGLVAASLNDSWLDGTTPVGGDDVVGSSPGQRMIIPGVTATGGPGSLVLRLSAVDRESVVRVRLLGADGPLAAPVNNGVVRVAAHRVKDVDLSAVPAGDYGIELTADEPVVAAAELRPAAGPPAGATATTTPPPNAKRDLAWTSAQPAVASLAGYPLGSIVAPWSATLRLSAGAEDASVDVVLVAADGTQSVQPVRVQAGTSVAVPIASPVPSPPTNPPASPPASVWVRVRAGSVAAAVVTGYADPAGAMTSVAPLGATPLRTSPVSVHPLPD